MDTPPGIRLANVTRFFRDSVPGGNAPLSFELISGGRSNLTYRVDMGGRSEHRVHGGRIERARHEAAAAAELEALRAPALAQAAPRAAIRVGARARERGGAHRAYRRAACGIEWPRESQRGGDTIGEVAAEQDGEKTSNGEYQSLQEISSLSEYLGRRGRRRFLFDRRNSGAGTSRLEDA